MSETMGNHRETAWKLHGNRRETSAAVVNIKTTTKPWFPQAVGNRRETAQRKPLPTVGNRMETARKPFRNRHRPKRETAETVAYKATVRFPKVSPPARSFLTPAGSLRCTCRF